MNAPFGSLNLRDWLKGLYMAVIAAIGASLIPIINSGRLPTIVELKGIGITALVFAIGYLVKNLVGNSQGGIGPEPKVPPVQGNGV